MKILNVLFIFFLPLLAHAQQQDSDTTVSLKSISEKSLNKIEKSAQSLNAKIEHKTLKAIKKLQKQEQAIYKKLAKVDSVAAKQLAASKGFSSLSLGENRGEVKLKEYIPRFDSLKTGLKFLESTNSLTSKFPKEWTDKVKTVNSSIQGLESRMQQAGDVQKFMKERKQQLKEQIEKYGFSKELKKMNKQVYYYQQQINEYKVLLKDPKKIEQRAITELRKLPAFKAFMQKNSQLSQLFKLPDNYGTPQALAGLQTRASVQDQLQQRFGSAASSPSGGGVGGGYVQQQIEQAQSELNKLKDKLNNSPLGAGGTASPLGAGGEMPDFKPNTLKTKSFLKRLEYGANIQSQKTNGLLPVTSDIALTAGYKLNDKSVIGIGAAYKLGWGSGIKDIKLSSQGIGLRSYIDYKIKGNFWISGGYEQNYQSALRGLTFTSPTGRGREGAAWQTSGLIGLTKKYKIGKKTNNLQVLWDFMSYRQVPRRQPVVFRVGYEFK